MSAKGEPLSIEVLPMVRDMPCLAHNQSTSIGFHAWPQFIRHTPKTESLHTETCLWSQDHIV